MVYKKRYIRNTGKFFLLAPVILNPKYAPVHDTILLSYFNDFSAYLSISIRVKS